MDYLFYTCLLLFATDVRGVITNAPLNAVAEVGQQAIFNCTSDLPSPNWVLSAKREDLIASAGKTIVYGCVVQTGFTTHYYVDRPGGNINICNLIVNDTTMQQAGIYTCTDSAPGPSAILTVTDKLINATYNTTAGVVVEKENVIIECVLNYNGTLSPAPTLRPYFYWTDFNEQNVSSSYNSTTDDTAVSQLTVTAGRQNITSYTCHVYFQPMPPTNTGYASNTPTVSNSATSIITVFYYPIISSITKVPACPGETVVNLTCNATAYPAPTYSWIGPDSRNYSGQTIEVVMNGSYTCNASNVIRGSTHWDTKTETQTNASPLCWFWPLLVLFLIPLAVVAIFYILYLKARKVADEASKAAADAKDKKDNAEKAAEEASQAEKVKSRKDADKASKAAADAEDKKNNAQNRQTVCGALSIICMIIGIILFPISVYLIYDACDKQCDK